MTIVAIRIPHRHRHHHYHHHHHHHHHLQKSPSIYKSIPCRSWHPSDFHYQQHGQHHHQQRPASAATGMSLSSATCCGPAAEQFPGNAVNAIAWHDTDGDNAISIPADFSKAKHAQNVAASSPFGLHVKKNPDKKRRGAPKQQPVVLRSLSHR